MAWVNAKSQRNTVFGGFHPLAGVAAQHDNRLNVRIWPFQGFLEDSGGAIGKSSISTAMSEIGVLYLDSRGI